MFNNILVLIRFCVDLNARHLDERSQNLFLVTSCVPALTISIAYLYFVNVLGPAWMKNRPPFTLKYVMMIYNAFQVAANSYLTHKTFTTLYSNNKFSKWSCLESDRSNSDYAISTMHCIHFYYLLKILDLLDTVFFVLRKHNNQITFLHVYHHWGMVLSVYVALRYGLNGQGVFMGFMNSLVHIVMYFYYFTSAIRPSMKNSLWWKKYITQMQILQFSLNIVHFGAAMLNKDCNEPKYILLYMVIQNIYMLLMFGDFYIKSYLKKPKSQKTT